MSKEIESFLSSLKRWDKNFEIKDFVFEGDCELNKIYSLQRSKNVERLLDVWEHKCESKFFELEHPSISNLNTRAVHNVRQGMVNFVFMIDEKNNHPWIFCQCFNMIDFIITDNYIYKMGVFENVILNALSKLVSVDKNLINFVPIPFGFTLGINRPFHYFYDHLKFFYKINSGENAKSVEYVDAFYKPKDAFQNSLKKVFLFPAVIRRGVIDEDKSDLIKVLNESMEKKVVKEILQGVEKKSSEPSVLKLWYGITGQKRCWFQQIEAIEKIVNKLLQYFFRVEVFIDGMTSPESKIKRNIEDDAVFDEVAFSLDGSCKVKSLIGEDYIEKIKSCHNVDCFIANGGTGCLVPLRFCGKPGVIHSNYSVYSFPKKESSLVKYSEKKHTLQVLGEDAKKLDYASYHIPWEHIFNLTAEVINKVKGVDIQPLEVPSVEEVAKMYSIKKKEKISHLNAFNALEKRVTSSYKSPDILRETALAFEISGDIPTALAIMKKALDIRPTGCFIKKKVDEYTQILQEKGNQP